MESKLKHLELIQGVINRLASDSFRMKGWAVFLVAAMFVLVAREAALDAGYIALLPIIPIIAFWGLDGYFLWNERLFRAHYDNVRNLSAEAIDFSMDVRECRSCWHHSWFGATLSRTLLVFYGTLLVLVLVADFALGGESGAAAALRSMLMLIFGNG